MALARAKSLYEKVLANLGRRRLPAPPRPRASAAVVLWRRRGEGQLEVFWLRRADGMAFMGGWYAFPGGGLAGADAEVPVLGAPRGGEGHPSAAAMPETLTEGLGDPGPNLVPGLAACALRELLEETGVLPLPRLAAGAGDALALEAELGAARHALLDQGRPFAEVAAEYRLRPDASRLVYAGRWLTPPLAPMRFDNRFFLLEWPAELPVQPLVVPGEADLGEWIAPREGVDRWWRGEVMTAPPILHILRVLAEEGPEEGLPRLREPEEANLGPYRRVEFRPGVLMLPLPTPTLPPATHTNAYLLGTGELVLIDPGSRDREELERLAAALADAEARGHRVTAIWLTHHHRDHVDGVPELKRRLGLPVWAHAATAERLGPRLRVDRQLEDGETVTLAGDPALPVRVIHTPGHAPGHLCFLEEIGGSLIAGDMLSSLSTIVVDPPEGDMDAYLASLEKLARLEPAVLFPGHGPPLRDGVGKLRELIEHRRWREERILDAWRAGLKSPAAICPRVYDDVPEEAHPLAERQIEAHLIRLRRAGSIE